MLDLIAECASIGGACEVDAEIEVRQEVVNVFVVVGNWESRAFAKDDSGATVADPSCDSRYLRGCEVQMRQNDDNQIVG